MEQRRREFLLAQVVLERFEVHQHDVLLREVLRADARSFAALRRLGACVEIKQ